MKYDFTAIEKKWQKVWADGKVFAAENGSDKEKFYALVEFPYPSGDETDGAVDSPDLRRFCHPLWR